MEDAELNCVSAMSVGALFPGRLNDVRNAVLKDPKPSVSSPIELVVIDNHTSQHSTLSNPYILATDLG